MSDELVRDCGEERRRHEEALALADLPAQLTAFERALVERLEERHIALLGRSLDVVAALEARLAETERSGRAAREQASRAELEREALRRERDDACAARIRADIELGCARLEGERLACESRACRAEVAQLQARRSWRYTAPFRALYHWLWRQGRRE